MGRRYFYLLILILLVGAILLYILLARGRGPRSNFKSPSGAESAPAVNTGQDIWHVYRDGVPVNDLTVNYASAVSGSPAGGPETSAVEGPFSIAVPGSPGLNSEYTLAWTYTPKHFIPRASVMVPYSSSLRLNKADITCRVVKILNKGAEGALVSGIHLALEVEGDFEAKNPKFWRADIFLYGDGGYEIK